MAAPVSQAFDRLPLDCPACISTVCIYSFRALVYFLSSLVPFYPTVLYATHLTSPATAGPCSVPRWPTLPHFWPMTTTQPALAILTAQLPPHDVMIHLSSYGLSLEMLNMYINPSRPRTRGSIAQNITFPTPFFFLVRFQAFSRVLAFFASRLPIQAHYRAAVPTRA